MPTNITDVDEFSDPVPIPSDGEAASYASLLQFVQKLCNRTRYLKNKLEIADAYAQFEGSGSNVAADALMTLTEFVDPNNKFSVASNEVTFPALGRYTVDVSCQLRGDSTSANVLLAAWVYVGATLVAVMQEHRASTEAAEYHSFSANCIVTVADLATDKLKVVIKTSAGTTDVGSTSIVIRRIS